MSEERKKPGWAFWVTVVLLSLVLYVASVGPMEWLDAHDYLPIPIKTACQFFYWPLALLASKSSLPGKILIWYVGLWTP